jgi:hypothetical protein
MGVTGQPTAAIITNNYLVILIFAVALTATTHVNLDAMEISSDWSFISEEFLISRRCEKHIASGHLRN